MRATRVLVLHAWWGLNDALRAFCDRLAGAGFVAFAPDLYHGAVADTIEGAEALGGALDAELVCGRRPKSRDAAVFLLELRGPGPTAASR